MLGVFSHVKSKKAEVVKIVERIRSIKHTKIFKIQKILLRKCENVLCFISL